MLTIGEFAHATGLTVKALRHYDERELLVPAVVDPVSRHRRYSGGQLHTAVLVKALRAAGMPVESVRRATRDGADVPAALEHFRGEVAAARAAQDRALAAVARLVEGFDGAVEIFERDVPATHTAAVVHRLPADGQEAAALAEEDRAIAAHHALFAVLTRAHVPPTGPGWTRFDAVDGDPERIELSLCWALPGPPPELPADIDGIAVHTGSRPAVRELVVRMDCGEDAQAPDDLPHPAFVALSAELARRESRGGPAGVDAVRQFVTADASGRLTVELAVPLVA
ncbi:MerR family transcriptional regulator [Pseudonocardia sp. HH130630-07]|uniref:MerR family transcriptional regulator n=1 Tax=Pseudonocardia sp. HH130630-07 TaxID=1690815 RepID=UPI000814BD88|nr:MerR family transcriptional regulator [Pseudonocardia sp. HH130630-07]ANY05125.1 hypothetical protein AFB00_00960 [Pseudonocardia sp. HH130630-07]